MANNGRQDQKAPSFVTYSRNFCLVTFISIFISHAPSQNPKELQFYIWHVVSPIMTRLGLNVYGKIFDELW